MREREQLVGRVPHRREDADDAVALSRAATSRAATRFSLSGSATEVPPNFITTVPSGARVASASTAGTASYSVAAMRRV